jgi:hypothetical protein
MSNSTTDWRFLRQRRQYAFDAKAKVHEYLGKEKVPKMAIEIATDLDLDLEFVNLLLEGAGASRSSRLGRQVFRTISGVSRGVSALEDDPITARHPERVH